MPLLRALKLERRLRLSVSCFLLFRDVAVTFVWDLFAGLIIQEVLFLLLLLFLGWPFRIERFHLAFLRWRELGQMPYEHDELPAIVVFLLRVPRRHSGKPNAIVDDVVDLSVREPLRVGQTHVRRLRIQIVADLCLSASVIAVANGAMIGEVSSRFAENRGGWRKGVRRVAFGGRNRKPPRRLGDVSLHC